MKVAIEDRNADGRGRGRVGERMLLVSQAHPGEVVTVRVDKTTKGTIQGRVGRILARDPERIEHSCLHEFHCTGCPLLAVPPALESKFKEEQLAGLIAALPEGNRPAIDPMLSPGPLFGYRHHAKQVFVRRHGRVVLGSFAAGTHQVVDNDGCPVLVPPLARLLAEVAEEATEIKVRVHDDETAGLKFALARWSRAANEAVLCLVSSEPECAEAQALATNLLGKHKFLRGVEIILQTESTNTLLRGDTVGRFGRLWIEEEILGFRHRVAPRAFFQINPLAAEVLFRRALELAGEGRVCLEGYSGVGALTMPLTTRFEKVIAIESVEESVSVLRQHQASLPTGRLDVIAGRVEDELGSLLARHQVDGLVLDPPRAGVLPAVFSALANSKVRRIVLLSCDPATLVRDAPRFSETGFVFRHLSPLDQFPRTAHFETVALFERDRGSA